MEKKYEFKPGDVITPHKDTGYTVVSLMAIKDIDYIFDFHGYVITILKPFSVVIKLEY